MQLTEFNRCFSVAFNTALFFLSLSKSGTYNNRKLGMSIKLFPEATNKGQYMLFMFSFFLSCFFMGPLRNFSCVNIVRRWPGGLPWIQLPSLRDSDWLCSTAPAAATEEDSPVKARRRRKGKFNILFSCRLLASVSVQWWIAILYTYQFWWCVKSFSALLEVVFEFRPGNYLNILGSDEKPGVHGHFLCTNGPKRKGVLPSD